MSETYRIIRFRNGGRNTVERTGLSLKQAQAHCSDPETSSRTAKRGRGGSKYDWFDGYERE